MHMAQDHRGLYRGRKLLNHTQPTSFNKLKPPRPTCHVHAIPRNAEEKQCPPRRPTSKGQFVEAAWGLVGWSNTNCFCLFMFKPCHTAILLEILHHLACTKVCHWQKRSASENLRWCREVSLPHLPFQLSICSTQLFILSSGLIS